jgi:hypothetical protein
MKGMICYYLDDDDANIALECTIVWLFLGFYYVLFTPFLLKVLLI